MLITMNNYYSYIFCALLLLALGQRGNAQTRSLPQSVRTWMTSPGLEHATITLEVVRLPQRASEVQPTPEHPAISRGQVIHSFDADRFVIPASVMKLVTAATGFRILGPDYIWPDSIGLIDTAQVALPGLECYNPDWLIEDIDTEYMQPMDNLLPDSGRVFREVMRETLCKSLNLQAETTLHLLTPSCRLDSGLLAIQEYWEPRGLDLGSLIMYDGCGLSPSDRVTAHFITSLLADMQFDDAFRQSLALASREGTVRRFLKGTRLEAKARLKTGTIKSVVAYAGYVKGSDARTYAVAIFVNNHTAKNAEVRKDIEKVLLSLIP